MGFRPWMSWVQTVYTSSSGGPTQFGFQTLDVLGSNCLYIFFRGSNTIWVSDLGCLGFKPIINLFQEVLHNLGFRPWITWVQTFYNLWRGYNTARIFRHWMSWGSPTQLTFLDIGWPGFKPFKIFGGNPRHLKPKTSNV